MQAGAQGCFDHDTKDAGSVQPLAFMFKNRAVLHFLFASSHRDLRPENEK
jgi:hypothetical protein